MRKFFVHIIESPSAKDLLNHHLEGYFLTEGLRITEIASYYNLAVNKSTFLESVGKRFSEAIKKYGFPFLHISAHGDKNGIELTDKTFLSWVVLKKILLPINNVLGNTLLLNISSCSGFSACKMAMDPGKEAPFFGLIGPLDKVDFADTTIAFVAFYHNLAKGASPREAVEAMKKASRNNSFGIIRATTAKKAWVDKIRESEDRQLIESLLKIPPLK